MKRTTPEEYKWLHSREKSEGDIQRETLDALLGLGLTVWRNQSGHVRTGSGYLQLGPIGSPDLVGYLPCGRFLGIEVKRPGEKPSKEQAAWLAKASKAGVACTWVTSAKEAVDYVRARLSEAESDL